MLLKCCGKLQVLMSCQPVVKGLLFMHALTKPAGHSTQEAVISKGQGYKDWNTPTCRTWLGCRKVCPWDYQMASCTPGFGDMCHAAAATCAYPLGTGVACWLRLCAKCQLAHHPCNWNRNSTLSLQGFTKRLKCTKRLESSVMIQYFNWAHQQYKANYGFEKNHKDVNRTDPARREESTPEMRWKYYTFFQYDFFRSCKWPNAPKVNFQFTQWKVPIILWPVNCTFPQTPYHLRVPHWSQTQAFYIWRLHLFIV